MKRNKAILSMALASIMALGSSATFAANGDIWVRDESGANSGNKYASAEEATTDKSKGEEVTVNQSSYLYEHNGFLYSIQNLMKAYREDLSENKITFLDILETFTALEETDTAAPVITGIADNDTINLKYTQTGAIPKSEDTDIDEVSLTRDSVIVEDYSLGTAITEVGIYTLKVTDISGNETVVNFEIIDKSVSAAKAPILAESSTATENIENTFFLSSEAGEVAEQYKQTIITFNYNSSLDGKLEYTIIGHTNSEESVTSSNWFDVPKSGEKTSSETVLDESYDVWVRVKAVEGVNLASSPIKGLDSVIVSEPTNDYEKIINAIDGIKEEITLDDKETIEGIRASYEALTEEQRQLVTNLHILESAEAKIVELEKEQESNNIKLMINGLELESEVKPKVIEYTTYIPAISVLEAIGAEVTASDESNIITANFRDKAISIDVDSNIFTVDGTEHYLYRRGPVSSDGDVLVPVRLLDYLTGIDVLWDEDSRVIDIQINTTKADLAHFIASNYDLESVETAGKPNDIKGNEYENDIIEVVEAGIMAPSFDEAFRPNDIISRAQLASILVNVKESQKIDLRHLDYIPEGVTDISSHQGNMSILVNLGIIEPDDSNKVYPYRSLTVDYLNPNTIDLLNSYDVLEPTDEKHFEIDKETGTILDYTGENKAISIPSEINGVIIKEIGQAAFAHRELTRIELPESISKIGHAAFYSNKLMYLNLPDNIVEIGGRAFEENNLISIHLSNGLTEIADSVFAINSLRSISIPSGITSIGDFAFSNNHIENIVIPSNVTRVGSYSFYRNALVHLDIPNNITEIGTHAFSHNTLENLSLSNNLTKISSSAFTYNQLTSIDIPDSVTEIASYAFTKNKLNKVTVPTNTAINDNTFDSYVVIVKE